MKYPEHLLGAEWLARLQSGASYCEFEIRSSVRDERWTGGRAMIG